LSDQDTKLEAGQQATIYRCPCRKKDISVTVLSC